MPKPSHPHEWKEDFCPSCEAYKHAEEFATTHADGCPKAPTWIVSAWGWFHVKAETEEDARSKVAQALRTLETVEPQKVETTTVLKR